ncbi:MAG: DUF2846 domain-containing protein [Pseudomonadota bacterium]
MTFKKIIFFLLAFSLSGCATNNSQHRATTEPTNSSINKESFNSSNSLNSRTPDIQNSGNTPSSKEITSRLYFYRSPGLFGAALQPSIHLDGKKIGQSKPGELFFVDTFAGSHEVIVRNTLGNDPDKKLTFALGDHDTKYIKTLVGTGSSMGYIVPEAISASAAQKELSTLNLTENR